jgi:hypothetical protein
VDLIALVDVSERYKEATQPDSMHVHNFAKGRGGLRQSPRCRIEMKAQLNIQT